MNDGVKMTGHISWELTRVDGTIEKGSKQNVVTDYGKQWIASILGSGITIGTWFGFGTSSTAAAVGNTILAAELSTSGTSYSRVTTTRSNSAPSNMVQYQGTLTGLTLTGLTIIREVGIFGGLTSGASGVTIIARQTTGDIQFTSSSDSLAITWQITFS
jgi:hypothetical protein